MPFPNKRVRDRNKRHGSLVAKPTMASLNRRRSVRGLIRHPARHLVAQFSRHIYHISGRGAVTVTTTAEVGNDPFGPQSAPRTKVFPERIVGVRIIPLRATAFQLTLLNGRLRSTTQVGRGWWRLGWVPGVNATLAASRIFETLCIPPTRDSTEKVLSPA